MKEILYRVNSVDPGVDWDDRYIALQLNGYLCRECKRILPHVFPKPLDVVVSNPSDVEFGLSCGFAKAANCLLFNKLFLRFLPLDSSECATGSVFLGDGSRSEHYVTCYTKENNWLLVSTRGGHYDDKTCSECGGTKNTAWIFNNNGYVRRSQLQGNGVWIAAQHTLVVNAEWKERIVSAGFPNLKFTSIDVESD